jgi:hypothetical protein
MGERSQDGEGTTMKIGGPGIGILVAAWALAHPSSAGAQVGSVPPLTQGSSMPASAMMSNPYLNPYLNPYMNPAMTQQPMNSNNALLYLYAAQAANGGVGSGRMSGARMQATQPRAALAGTPASTPGGGAARFFNPGPVNVNGAGRYYNRSGRYFMNNGR